MMEKILVTYASRNGSTIGIAGAIGKTLMERGLLVTVCPMADVDDLRPFDAVVAGSAIREGKWLPEAVQFVEVHCTELAQKPFATFLVCMTMAMKNNPQAREMVSTWMQPIRNLVKPISEGLLCWRLGHQQSANSASAVDVPHQCDDGRLDGRRSPRLGRHSCLGGHAASPTLALGQHRSSHRIQ
jgi:hypothetical protein